MYPRFIYEIHATVGGIKDHQELHIATFFDVTAASDFCASENAEIGAEQLTFESRPLIDRNGNHCEPKDICRS